MIAGAHLLLYSKDAETDRAFVKRPNISQPLPGSMDESGGDIGLYQPTHPTMIEARSA